MTNRIAPLPTSVLNICYTG